MGVEVGLAIMQTMAVPTPSIAKLSAITLHTGFGTNHFACMRTHAVVILSRTVPSPLGWVWVGSRRRMGPWHAAALQGGCIEVHVYLYIACIYVASI